MLSVLCGIVISLGTWYVGIAFSGQIRERIYLIEQFMTLALHLESGITYGGCALRRLLKDFNGLKDFTSYTDREMNSGKSLEKIWRGYPCGHNYVLQECVRLLCCTAGALEGSDAAAAGEALRHARKELECYKNTIVKEYAGKLRLYPAVGLITGVFLSVLLLP